MELIKFNTPAFLLIGIVLLLALWLYQRTGIPAPQASIIRLVVIALIILGLSDPMILLRTGNQCILFVIDVSKSISRADMDEVKQYLHSKIGEIKQGDRIGVIEFAEDVNLILPPIELSGETFVAEISHLMDSDKVHSGFTDIEGALLMASKVFPEGFQKKIVLIADGNENTGKVANVYNELKSMHITTDVLAVGGVKHNEVFVKSLTAPTEIRTDNPFLLEVAIGSNTEIEGEIQITAEGQRNAKTKNSIKIVQDDHQVYKFPVTLKEGGFHTIHVDLFVGKDGFSVNNKATTLSYAKANPEVALVGSQSPDKSRASLEYLGDILMGNGINSDYILPEELPFSMEAYGRYNAVVLNDISSEQLVHKQMEALSSAVHDLGVGLIMIGGANSIGPGGFTGTPVESALPVRLEPSSGKGPSSIDLVMVMDKSGSMSEGDNNSKIGLALDAMQSIIELFGKEDRTGIIAFDSQPHVVASPGSLKNREELTRKIQGIVPRGSTDIYPALLKAYGWLKVSEATYRHIILLSDGKTRERDFKELISKIQSNGISISVVGIGRDSNIPLMKEIAHRGKGRFFQVEEDLHDLSKIFRIDALMAAGSLQIEETFSPHLKDPDPIINGIPISMPEMHGYMVTSPRKTAVVPVASHKGDPVIGFWRYGLGKAAIFTGDDGSRWSGDWISWDRFGRLWVQLVRRTFSSASEKGKPPVFNIRGNRVDVYYATTEKVKGVIGNITAKLFFPGGKTSDMRLIQSSPGIYNTIITDLDPGKYMMIITNELSGTMNGLSRGSFMISGALEFHTLKTNDTLLADIASHTGGRVLAKEDPLFERNGEGVDQYIAIWPYLFACAVILFLFEIARSRGIHPFKSYSRHMGL